MATMLKITSGNHHGISATLEMSSILEFFSKEITGFDDARDVSNFCGAELAGLTNVVFLEIYVFGAFVCDGGRPIDAEFVVIVYGDAFGGVVKMEVASSI